MEDRLCDFLADGSFRCATRETVHAEVMSRRSAATAVETFAQCDASMADVMLPYDNRTNCLDACAAYATNKSCDAPMHGDPTQYTGACKCMPGAPTLSTENRRCGTADGSPLLVSLPFYNVQKSCPDACAKFETLNGCARGRLAGVPARRNGNGGGGGKTLSSGDLLSADNHFRIVHPDGRPWLYDDRTDTIRLASGRPMMLTVDKNPNVYGADRGRVALRDSESGRFVRHAWMILHLSPFSGNNYDFAWMMMQTGSDGMFRVLNDFAGGHVIGYDNVNDAVLIVGQSDRRVVDWTLAAISPGDTKLNDGPKLCMCVQASDTVPRPPLLLKQNAQYLL